MSRIFTCFLILTALWGKTLCHAERLYIFYPSTYRPYVIQKNLSNIYPDLEIIVFGRHHDFETTLKTDPPDMVITKPIIIEKFSHYQIKYLGSKKNLTDEPFVLLSVKDKIDLTKLNDKVIGVVNLLGRSEMRTILKSYFNEIPRIKCVNKIEDLLPLLTMEMADAVFVNEENMTYLRNISELDLVATELPKVRLGIIALAGKNDSIRIITDKFDPFNQYFLSTFGIEKWEERN